MKDLIILLILFIICALGTGKMTFHLYTRENPQQDQILTTENPELLKSTNFNLEWPVRFVIHGWMSSAKEEICISIKDAYLQKQDYNVITVDWSKEASRLYTECVLILPALSYKLAEFIRMLIANEVTYDQIYLIGHSLGAQMSGLAGHNLSSQIAVIFGLDPAGPGYDGTPPEYRLDSGDAQNVESIQTSAGTTGFNQPVGGSSFFPNSGLTQRGCSLSIGCSHSRSYQYFAESINSEVGFYGVPCSFRNILRGRCKNSLNIWYAMGGDPYTKKEGTYYLKTNSKSPFAIGKTLIVNN